MKVIINFNFFHDLVTSLLSMRKGRPNVIPGAKGPVVPSDAQRIRDQVEEHMTPQGLRWTAQRRLILDTLLEMNGHVTVPGLLEVVRRLDPNVGLATVHRAMRLFVESGVVDEHQFGDAFTHFEVVNADSHHDHLVCTQCGSINEFEEPLIEQLQARVAERYAFDIVHHRHVLYGLCAECQADPNRSRAKRPRA